MRFCRIDQYLGSLLMVQAHLRTDVAGSRHHRPAWFGSFEWMYSDKESGLVAAIWQEVALDEDKTAQQYSKREIVVGFGNCKPWLTDSRDFRDRDINGEINNDFRTAESNRDKMSVYKKMLLCWLRLEGMEIWWERELGLPFLSFACSSRPS
jgi:hypothetical protein